MRRTNQQGFGVVGIVVVLLVVAGVGFAGYQVWHRQKATSSKDNSQTVATKGNDNKALKTYHDSVGRYSINYPTTAKLSAENPMDDASSVSITFSDGVELGIVSNLGGRGIPFNCTYDEATGKTTWEDPAGSGSCPYTTIVAAQQLPTTANDANGALQHVYLIDNTYTTGDGADAKADRRSCLVLGPVAETGKKIYGVSFVDRDMTTYASVGSADRFMHACSSPDNSTAADYFSSAAIKEQKAVLATFKLDN